MTGRPPLDDDDDDALAARIGATARDAGLPSLAPPGGAPAPSVGPRRPIKLEVSDALFRELTVQAAAQGVTKRFLILSALQAAGFPVGDADLAEDGRRLRGSRKA